MGNFFTFQPTPVIQSVTMGVPNPNLDALEEQRLVLENNILELQKSLYHWRTWEAEYDGLREDLSNLPNDALAEDVLAVGREFGGTLVNEDEVRVILGGKEGVTRSRAQVVDILGGRVSGMILNVLTAKPHIEQGAMRALGITGLKRSEAMPNVPTIDESAVPKYEALQWFGILAPAQMEASLGAQLNGEFNRVLQAEEFRKRLAALGIEPIGGSPEDFAKLLAKETARWTALIRELGITSQ